MKSKVCTKCNHRRRLSDFYFRKENNCYRNECVFCMGRRKEKILFIDAKKKLKECSKCHKIKSFQDFNNCKANKNKLVAMCKVCRYEQIKIYRNAHPDKMLKWAREFELKVRKERPWILYWESAKQRCENPKTIGYLRYGGRGIKILLTKEDVKFLWFRDKAWLLKKPSLHRKDNDGNYTIENCEFIEFKYNSKMTSSTFIIQQLSKKGKLIKSWESYKDFLREFDNALKESKLFLNYKWNIAHY